MSKERMYYVGHTHLIAEEGDIALVLHWYRGTCRYIVMTKDDAGVTHSVHDGADYHAAMDAFINLAGDQTCSA